MKKILLSALLLVSSLAVGHAYHFGMTEMSVNPTNGSLEVVHNYFVRDFAMAVNGGADIAMDEELVRAYMAKHFQVLSPESGMLDFNWIGMTIDSEYVTIYQELPNAELGDGKVVVKSTVLYEIELTQTNTINVLMSDSSVRSYTFDKEQDTAVIELF